MSDAVVNVSLPKGEILEPLARLFENVKFPITGYNAKNRTYRPEIKGLPVRAKIMAEKDVAIQVAVENYDIGFCGFDWIKEHAIKYKGTKLHIFKHLHFGRKKIYVCSGNNSGIETMDDLKNKAGYITIVSEYPNIAKNFAIQNRLRKFKIFSAWGSVEAYPPEHADIVILAASDENALKELYLNLLKCELESDVCLVVNKKNSLRKRNIPKILKFFSIVETNK